MELQVDTFHADSTGVFYELQNLCVPSRASPPPHPHAPRSSGLGCARGSWREGGANGRGHHDGTRTAVNVLGVLSCVQTSTASLTGSHAMMDVAGERGARPSRRAWSRASGRANRYAMSDTLCSSYLALPPPNLGSHCGRAVPLTLTRCGDATTQQPGSYFSRAVKDRRTQQQAAAAIAKVWTTPEEERSRSRLELHHGN
jgi:hypothetical protein